MFRETARKIIDLWLIASNVAIYERGSLLELKWYSILPMQASALHIYTQQEMHKWRGFNDQELRIRAISKALALGVYTAIYT